ncbi:MAG TPA: ribonuclease H-like domain-containing protein [Candidatus Binatia bacterium]|nr:ribonuclease H-like domain-containing protein [Candidatus Binatia bacterium]
MLDRTFVHIPGVGPATERKLWEVGIRTWADVERLPSVPVRGALARKLAEYVPRSQRALKERDAAFFANLASAGESWRLFDAFADACVYLDIETTGLSPIFNTITMVGLYDGRLYRPFIDGHNLHEVPRELERYAAVVTFNGAQFDLRFLEAAFPKLKLPPVHIDLRWLTRRLGYRGSLKAIEAAFGLERPEPLRCIDGFGATVLWSRYLRGDDKALNDLIEYNVQDVVNLKVIMECSYRMMAQRVGNAPSLMVRKNDDPVVKVQVSANHSVIADRGRPSLVRTLLKKAKGRGASLRVVGIDLSGSEKRASGWALLDHDMATTQRIKTDKELVERTIASEPDLVSIDSPLSLPGGKANLRQWKRAKLPIYRGCELALKRMGISVFWCLLPSMRTLTLRGIKLAEVFRRAGIPVIESYPGAAQDLLRIPRKGTSLEELRWGMRAVGVTGDFLGDKTSHDEVDAITSALVGLFFSAGEFIQLGNHREGYLVVPKTPQINYRALSWILGQTGLDSVPADTHLAVV